MQQSSYTYIEIKKKQNIMSFSSSWNLYEDYKVYSKRSKIPLKPFLNVNFYVNIIFRISHFLYKCKFFPLSKLFWLVNRIFFSIDIDPGAKLAGGLEIVHGTGIVVGRYVQSKGPMKIYQGSTIGGNSGKTNTLNNVLISQPILYPNVVIGINAVVIGPILLGENSIIGSNAVVTKNVERNSTIVGYNKLLKKK